VHDGFFGQVYELPIDSSDSIHIYSVASAFAL